MITPIETQLAKSGRREIGKTVSRSSRDHEVLSLRMLQDAPHCLHIFRRPSPVSLNCEVAKLNSRLTTNSNATGSANDLFGNKALWPKGRFMIEQDPIGSKQTVRI